MNRFTHLLQFVLLFLIFVVSTATLYLFYCMFVRMVTIKCY